MRKPKIFIDPGHGGNDNGTSGNGMFEKDINLLVARELAKIINIEEYQVMFSRLEDINITLAERTDRANKFGADLYVSIHHNGFSDSQANGIKIFYQCFNPSYIEKSNKAAITFYNYLTATFPQMRKIGIKVRGIKSFPGYEWHHVLRETKCPVVILETGFITNSQDAAIIKGKDFPFKQANALIYALDELFPRVETENLKLREGIEQIIKSMQDLLKLVK